MNIWEIYFWKIFFIKIGKITWKEVIKIFKLKDNRRGEFAFDSKSLGLLGFDLWSQAPRAGNGMGFDTI